MSHVMVSLRQQQNNNSYTYILNQVVVLSTQLIIIIIMALNSEHGADSIGERLKQRKRHRWAVFGGWQHPQEENSKRHERKDNDRPTLLEQERPRSRRRFEELTDAINNDNSNNQSNADVDIIRQKLGKHRHHGTGNPLAVRSPRTLPDLAIRNLAVIIRNGTLGDVPTSDSTPNLKTRMGNTNDHSFWTNPVEKAGSYGWTGLILPENTDTSQAYPVEQVEWFLVENVAEYNRLQSILQDEVVKDDNHTSSNNTWETVKDRVVTIQQLAEGLRQLST